MGQIQIQWWCWDANKIPSSALLWRFTVKCIFSTTRSYSRTYSFNCRSLVRGSSTYICIAVSSSRSSHTEYMCKYLCIHYSNCRWRCKSLKVWKRNTLLISLFKPSILCWCVSKLRSWISLISNDVTVMLQSQDGIHNIAFFDQQKIGTKKLNMHVSYVCNITTFNFI